MKIIFICFTSRLILDRFAEAGHDVASLDLSPARHDHPHIIADIDEYTPTGYDAAICCPPCQWLSKAQQYRFRKHPETQEHTLAAVERVRRLWSLPIDKILIENPPGHLNKMWRYPTQIVRPWYFGDPYSKEICLWLKNLPPLIATVYSTGRKSISNHTNARMTQEERMHVRSSWDRYPGLISAIQIQLFPAP